MSGKPLTVTSCGQVAAGATVAVRDAYARKDVGSFKGKYTQTLDSHDSVLIVLVPQTL